MKQPMSPIDSVRWHQVLSRSIGRSRSATMVLLICLAASSSAQTVTTESLLREMADRDALARFPHPAYKSLQTSSYDRASKEPGTEEWTANRDYSQFLCTVRHQGRTEHVMMDARGPGAVVRIWITWAGRPRKPFSNGTIRLYLDDGDDPLVEFA